MTAGVVNNFKMLTCHTITCSFVLKLEYLYAGPGNQFFKN